MSEVKTIILSSPEELAASFCEYFAELVNSRIEQIGFAAVAFSGGKTPDIIFRMLADDFHNRVDWQKLLVYWADERCVPPDDPESNFGRASELLIDKVEINPANVFRIRGEEDPLQERMRYAERISSNLFQKDNFPVFDLIMLGVGEDGHTASLFPGNEKLFVTDEITAVTNNPDTGQTRITLTGSLINHAANIAVIVSGISKKSVMGKILSGNPPADIPASHIKPVSGNLIWFMTADAAPGNPDYQE